METRWICIDAKRLTVYGEPAAAQASGGTEVYYTTLPRAARPPAGGKVLDLEAYRRRTAPSPAAQAPAAPTAAPSPAPGRPGLIRRLRQCSDLAATAAIVCMALTVAVKFLLLS